MTPSMPYYSNPTCGDGYTSPACGGVYTSNTPGSNLWNAEYDYIGNVRFDTTIPASGSVKIITDIDMAVNKVGINFDSHEIVLR